MRPFAVCPDHLSTRRAPASVTGILTPASCPRHRWHRLHRRAPALEHLLTCAEINATRTALSDSSLEAVEVLRDQWASAIPAPAVAGKTSTSSACCQTVFLLTAAAEAAHQRARSSRTGSGERLSLRTQEMTFPAAWIGGRFSSANIQDTHGNHLLSGVLLHAVQTCHANGTCESAPPCAAAHYSERARRSAADSPSSYSPSNRPDSGILNQIGIRIVAH